jgi:hypothetical protein
MRFMLLICHDSSFTARTVEGDSAAWLKEMEQRGVRKHGDRLRSAAEAKTVSMRDGELLVRDGPFAETNDEVAGEAFGELKQNAASGAEPSLVWLNSDHEITRQQYQAALKSI